MSGKRGNSMMKSSSQHSRTLWRLEQRPRFIAWVAVAALVVMTNLEHRLIPNGVLYPGVLTTVALLLTSALMEETPRTVGKRQPLFNGNGRALQCWEKALWEWGTSRYRRCSAWSAATGEWKWALRATPSGFLVGAATALLLLLTRRAHR